MNKKLEEIQNVLDNTNNDSVKDVKYYAKVDFTDKYHEVSKEFFELSFDWQKIVERELEKGLELK